MNTDKEKWMNDVFTSMEGHKRHQPRIGLFEEIQNKIYSRDYKVISLSQLKSIAIAASFIVALNIAAIYNNYNQNSFESNNMVSVETTGESLISNYYIYE